MTDLAADPEVTTGADGGPRRERRERAPLLALRDAAGMVEARVTTGDGGRRSPSRLDGVDLEIQPREIMAVLGEADSGDVALARLTLGLRPLARGSRWWRDRDVTDPTGAAARAARLRIQPVFHDPVTALDPQLRIVDAIGDAPVGQRIIAVAQKLEYVALHLNRVGIDPMSMRRFPQQFAAGQRMRIAIARALAVRPELLVWDDAFALLDVTERAQLLNLALDLRSALELTYLLVSRDPAIVAHASDRVTVLYRGRIVESGRTRDVLGAPAHPYTRTLLGASPDAGAATPAGSHGCAFRLRCPHVLPECSTIAPVLVAIAPGRRAACHLHRPA